MSGYGPRKTVPRNRNSKEHDGLFYINVAILICAIIILALLIPLLIGVFSTGDSQDSACDDCNPCTRDIRVHGGTCENRREPIGTHCTSACYNNSLGSGTCSAKSSCVFPPDACIGTCSSLLMNVTAGSIECPRLDIRIDSTNTTTNATQVCVGMACTYLFSRDEGRSCDDMLIPTPAITESCLTPIDLGSSSVCSYGYSCATQAAEVQMSTNALQVEYAAHGSVPSGYVDDRVAAHWEPDMSYDARLAYRTLFSELWRNRVAIRAEYRAVAMRLWGEKKGHVEPHMPNLDSALEIAEVAVVVGMPQPDSAAGIVEIDNGAEDVPYKEESDSHVTQEEQLAARVRELQKQYASSE